MHLERSLFYLTTNKYCEFIPQPAPYISNTSDASFTILINFHPVLSVNSNKYCTVEQLFN